MIKGYTPIIYASNNHIDKHKVKTVGNKKKQKHIGNSNRQKKKKDLGKSNNKVNLIKIH